MAFLFKKSNEEHRENLAKLSTATEIQNYCIKENIPMSQFETYCERRGIQIGGENAVNIQTAIINNFNCVSDASKRVKEPQNHQAQKVQTEEELEQIERNSSMGIFVIVAIVGFVLLWKFASSVSGSILPSTQTVNAMVETGVGLGEGVLWFFGILFGIYMVLLFIGLLLDGTRKTKRVSSTKQTREAIAHKKNRKEENDVIDVELISA